MFNKQDKDLRGKFVFDLFHIVNGTETRVAFASFMIRLMSHKEGGSLLEASFTPLITPTVSFEVVFWLLICKQLDLLARIPCTDFVQTRVVPLTDKNDGRIGGKKPSQSKRNSNKRPRNKLPEDSDSNEDVPTSPCSSENETHTPVQQTLMQPPPLIFPDVQLQLYGSFSDCDCDYLPPSGSVYDQEWPLLYVDPEL